MKSVVCIGTATQDVFLKYSDMMLVGSGSKQFIQLPLGDKLVLDGVTLSTGGNASNVAVSLARQGVDVEFIGAVGDDPAGRAIAEEFNHEGVGESHMKLDNQISTSYSTILLAPNGERTLLNYKGDNYKFFQDFDFSKIRTDYAYISSMGEIDVLLKTVDQLFENGVKIVFNPASRELEFTEKIRNILKKINVLILNKNEAVELFDRASVVNIMKEAIQEVGTIVITDGPNGVAATDGRQAIYGGMYEDVEVVDRLGAGDAFSAGFLGAITRGKSLGEAITFASANSTSVVQYIGAKEGLLSYSAKLHDMDLETVNLQEGV